MTSTSNQAPRLAIVGAGILGLAHAVAALDAGYRVTVVEQDHAAVTASIRNFGHVCTSEQAGELGLLADEARDLWLHLAQRAGLEVRVSGTLAVARSAEELAVVEALAARETSQPSQLVTAARAGELLGTVGTAHAPLGGILLENDLTANPRTTVARIAAWVQAHERGEVRFATTALGVETGRLTTNRGVIDADVIVVAAGHLLGRLLPGLAESGGVRECALQMTRVRAPRGLGLGPAVVTGTSMLRYGAFAGPEVDALRAVVQRDRPELLAMGANVMFTHQADGTLLLGDTHESFDSAPPFLREEWTRTLLDEAATLLGVPELEVLERWQGVYATSDAQDVLAAEPLPGVHAVTLTTGVGMTVGLALGARTVAAL